MNINRHNYEEYFLLYIDNELSVEERKAVEQFVSEQSDLAEELELLKASVIRPDSNFVFANKEVLMRSAAPSGLINETNCEEYFILYLDKELTVKEEAAVTEYLVQHPSAQHSFQLLKQTKLKPEELVFHDKQELYRYEQNRKVFAGNWWKMAAAAMVLLVTGWIWLNQDLSTANRGPIAVTEPAVKEKATVKQLDKTPETTPAKKQTDEVELKNTASPAEQVIASSPGLVAAKTQTGNKYTTAGKGRVGKEPVGVEIKADEKITAESSPLRRDIEKVQVGDVAKAAVESSLDNPHVLQINTTAEVPEDNNATLAFTSDNRSEHVFLTNIPVDGNVPLRGLLRKASRVINKVTTIKTGNRRGISIGNVEISIQ